MAATDFKKMMDALRAMRPEDAARRIAELMGQHVLTMAQRLSLTSLASDLIQSMPQPPLKRPLRVLKEY